LPENAVRSANIDMQVRQVSNLLNVPTRISFGRYEIIAGRLGESFTARAFMGRSLVLEEHASDVEAAIEAAKARISDRQRSRIAKRKNGIPLSEEYQEALEYLTTRLPPLSPSYLSMLRAHHRASERTLTSSDLAAAAGYADYAAANLHYGILGRKVAEYLDYTPRHRHSDGNPIWTMTLAIGVKSQSGEF
jgi:hypothetical protein